MRPHLRIVAVLLITCGVLLATGALVSFGLFSGIAHLVRTSHESDAETGARLIGLVGGAIGGTLLILSIPVVVTGVGLWRQRPWARVGAAAVAACSLLWVPWGTVLGGYALWVLFSQRARPLFDEAASSSRSDLPRPLR